MNPQAIANFKMIAHPVTAVAGILLIFFYSFLQRRDIKLNWVWFSLPLTLLAVVAGAVYFEWGYFRYDRYINPHDVFHYYIGAKYSKEMGYSDLYRCALAADMEGRALYSKTGTIRNLETYGYEPVGPIIKDAPVYKRRFTAARWEEFKKDIQFFQSIMPASKWNQVLRDKGYNAPPVWNMMVRTLTNHFPTSSWWSVNFLTSLDIILIALMLALIYAAFGGAAAAFSAAAFGVSFFMSYVHIKGALLRLDWVFCMAAAVCLLKFKRHKTAGALLAYAMMSRVFPLVFLFGPGAKCVWDFYATRKINRKYFEFFGTFAAVTAVLILVSFIADGGLWLWKEYIPKLQLHDKDISSTRMGFKYLFLGLMTPEAGYTSFTTSRQAMIEDHKVLWWFIQAVVLGVSFFAVRRLSLYESLAYGFVPMFFLVAPTFYYFVVLAVPGLLFVIRFARLSRAIGLAALFGVSLSAYLLNLQYNLDLTFCYYMSWVLALFAGYMILAAFMTRSEDADAETPGPEPRRQRWALLGVMGAAGLTVLIGLIIAIGTGGFSRAAAAAPAAQSQTTSPTGTAVLTFAGDTMFSRNVAAAIAASNAGFTAPLEVVAPYMQQADLSFCNLECPISGRGVKVDKRYTFNAPPEAIEGLTSASIDVVTLANNHILDASSEGMTDTISILDQAGIAHVGITTNDQPQTPVVLEVNGLRIGYLGYCDPQTPYAYAKEYDAFSVRPAKAIEAQCKADIEALRTKCDIVVVSMHWGVEYIPQHDARQEQLGQFLIDCGADIIAGHHPHVQQEPVWYKKGVIIYSMGNFVFDQHSRPLTRLSRLYRAKVAKDGVQNLEYLPLEIEKGTWTPKPTSQNFVPVPRG